MGLVTEKADSNSRIEGYILYTKWFYNLKPPLSTDKRHADPLPHPENSSMAFTAKSVINMSDIYNGGRWMPLVV